MTHNIADKNNKNNEREAWLIVSVVYLASISVTISMMKVPPVMKDLISYFNTNMATGGWFMSAFMVAGVILAIPVASLLGKWGPKKSGLLALGFTIFGSIFGGFAQSPVMLIIGRIIEGIGFAGIMVIAPAVISMWFEPQKRGLPMGIWATWVPVGMFIAYNLAKPLELAFSWRGLWWFNAIFALIAFLAYGRIVDYPAEVKSKGRGKLSSKSQAQLSQGLNNLNIWLLTFIFFIIGLVLQGYGNWLPSFLIDSGAKATVANFNASLISMGAIPAVVIAGLILTCTKKHKDVLIIGLMLSTMAFSLWFKIGSVSAPIPWMLAIGFFSGLVPTCIFTMATENTSRPEFIGIALALVNMGFNFGAMIGPPIIGVVVTKVGWVAVKYFVIIPIIVGIGFALTIRTKQITTTFKEGDF